MKKIEEFDNNGLDLSRSAQHKTHPGGFYSILMVIVTIAVIGSKFFSFFTQPDTVIMNYIFSFKEYSIAPVVYDNLRITGVVFLALQQELISDLMKYFKVFLEYQSDVTGKTQLIIFDCKIKENKCSFEIPLDNEYFKHYTMNANPAFGIENCKKLIARFDRQHPLLADCADDFDQIYEKDYIKNNFLFLEYNMPHFEVSLQGAFNQATQTNRVAFLVKKQVVHHYISELNLININYANELFTSNSHNETYANWLTPRLTDPNIEEDYNLRIIFSFRFKDDIIYYKLTKTSFFMTLVTLGGLLKLLSLIYLVPNIWNEYYMQKALFQVKELYKEDIQEDNEEEKLDIDWSKISFCKWFWATCCCNCGKRKKLIKKKYKALLDEYQCRSYIRPDTKSKWFDISKLMLQEDAEINEMLKESNNIVKEKEDDKEKDKEQDQDEDIIGQEEHKEE